MPQRGVQIFQGGTNISREKLKYSFRGSDISGVQILRDSCTIALREVPVDRDGARRTKS